MRMIREFIKGLWKENPLFRIVLGLCPALAVTTSMLNGIGMGLAATFVLVMSNLFVSLIAGFVPKHVRIPVYIVVISTFVTIVDLAMHAYFVALWDQLGIFIPLIVVNCIILGRAEAFASKNGPFLSIADGLGMGLGFTLALAVLGGTREIIGNGTILGFSLFGPDFSPMLLAILPPGAFIILGLFLAGMNKIEEVRHRAKGVLPPEPAEADATKCVLTDMDTLRKRLQTEEEKQPSVA